MHVWVGVRGPHKDSAEGHDVVARRGCRGHPGAVAGGGVCGGQKPSEETT